MVGGDHCQAVTRTDDETATDDHVAVAITIRGRTERQTRAAVGQRSDQFGRIDRVRIGMAAAKIGQRRAVDHRTRWSAETVFENGLRVGAVDRVHGVETHAEIRTCQQSGNAIEVEQGLQQFGIVGDRIDDADHHVADETRPDSARSISRLDDAIDTDLLRALINGIGKVRSPVRHCRGCT
jgi:hypothetical protein